MASPTRSRSPVSNASTTTASASSPSAVPVAELASMLRRSADIVERKEFHPLLYQTMRALTAYAGEYAEGLINNATASVSPPGTTAAAPTSQQQQHGQKGDSSKKSAFHDVPDDVLETTTSSSTGGIISNGQRATSSTTSSSATTSTSLGGAAAAAAAAAAMPKSESNQPQPPPPQQQQQQSHPTPRAPHKGVFSLKGIKKGIEKIGVDVNKFVGETHHEKSNSREDVPFDEYAWCDEHFTRGCHCKSRKNAANVVSDKRSGPIPSNSNHSTGAQNQNHHQQQQPTSSSASSRDNVVPELGNSSSKPCFQRPINPSSNLIANGWIDQQRRSKMRVVWKDVLASLVEGRRPGEETTLWIQRQVIDATTGKVTGLEALHQIPMKWLEDVNYVDAYGDHQFTLKVFNIAEEFYFRTRDEQSAQSWVLTLRSARDSSLEGNVRMAGGGAAVMGNNSRNVAATEKNPTAKDMGLHNLDDWDNTGKPPSQGGEAAAARGEGGESTTPIPPQAGGDVDTRGDNSHSNSFPTEQQPTIPSSSSRMSIAELRAIAHGAGFNTRGMERQDLERIAAHIRNGAYNPNPPSTAPNNTQHSMQQENAMREAEQSAMAEKYEKEQQAQKANEDAARRQKENEERIALEKMRREREEYEKRRIAEQMAADQQRRQRQEIEMQASEIKRRQEEDRLRKMAELQQQQQQAQAAAERKKRDDEEDFQRRQEEDRQRKIAAFQQQQQAQAAAERKRREEEEQRRKQQQVPPGAIPTPPTSGGYPQNFQQQQQPWQHQQHQQHHRPQQQQQNYQQWQQQHQQQQQNPQQFQQQGFPGQQQQPNQQQHPYNNFSNQNSNQQGGHQQHPQQQPRAHYQNQQHQQHQHQQPPRPQPADGNGTQGATPAIPSKYAKQMEEKNGEPCSASTLQIKRSILINWALQPPNLNMLRPIDHLITSIHTAMPPAYGVAGHAYFAKFTPIAQHELIVSASMGNHPDEEKLKKAVRKVRVFLHPDKLPRDLSSDQAFAARMLWDITSDSWEEFQKHKDELDWIRS